MKHSKTLLILIIALASITLGCMENTDYKQVSVSDLLAKTSDYAGKQVCVKGEIKDGQLEKKIILKNYTPPENMGVYAQVCGNFNSTEGIHRLKLKDIKPLLTLTTNKHAYHSKEELQAQVILFMDKKMPSASVTVSGITNSFGRDLIEETRELDLYEGKNTINFTFTTPDCEECAGLEPGVYFLTASVLIDDELRKTSVPIMLQEEQ
jgi:hypothetical protein